MRKITQQSVMLKNLRIGEAKQNTHTQRERGTKNISIRKDATVTNMNNKNNKVTKSLYIVTDLGQPPFTLFTEIA